QAVDAVFVLALSGQRAEEVELTQLTALHGDLLAAQVVDHRSLHTEVGVALEWHTTTVVVVVHRLDQADIAFAVQSNAFLAEAQAKASEDVKDQRLVGLDDAGACLGIVVLPEFEFLFRSQSRFLPIAFHEAHWTLNST